MSAVSTEEILQAGAADPFPARPGRRQAAFGFIFASSIINAISFGLMIPVLPQLLKSFVGGDTARAAEWQVLFAVTWGTMQFLWGPVLGSLSDRFGRRPVMLISVFGLAIDFLIMAFAPTIWWLFVGRVLNGLTAASFSTANAYVADVTPPQDRARRYGMMGSAFSFGFLIGPVLGGSLAEIWLRLPFMAAAALAFANGLYGLFILPESLPRERRLARFRWMKANPIASLGFLREHGSLAGLASINFLFQLSQNVWPTVFVLYAGARYHWSVGVIGAVMMIGGVPGIVVQMFFVGPVVRRIGERGALLLGAACGTIAMTIGGLAPTGPLYFCGMPFGALSGFMAAGLMGLMTQRVGPSEQGRLQGANQSLQGIASIIGPPLFGLSFAWALRHDSVLHQPGLPVLIAAGLSALCLLLGLRYARPAPMLAAA
ncbi:MAG TPA: TCR/Tet family MFS transporter [Caulobacteraceae bacterium]|nr:TCR/Tet family MFS transporter [Caulobacteraceae bacterium]